jgi:hypothetical protein
MKTTDSKVCLVGEVFADRVSGLPPGVVRYALTRPAQDDDGRVWQVGSEYTPSSGGQDNVRGVRVLHVTFH